jgi:type I restriction enzyme M protein
MAREVVPFSPDAQWDESKAKHGNEIPFTRIFYTPRAPRPLDEIDSEVQRLMGELADMFKLVSDQ